MDREYLTDEEVYQAVGYSLSRYAQIEFALASILAALIRLDFKTSNLIFIALKSTRARHELLSALFEAKFGAKITVYWNSCVSALQQMAAFRNAVAHWHKNGGTAYAVPEGHKALPITYALTPPPGQDGRITKSQMDLFTADCKAMQRLLNDLAKHAKQRPSALPKRFLRPISYQPQASHLPPPTATKPKRQRLPSVPKLSRAQRRAKALKDARLKRKET